jgi:hypothetical protein
MQDDLANKGILFENSKSEIIELIGKSESIDSKDIWIYNFEYHAVF